MPLEFAHELVGLVSRHDAWADGKFSWREQLPVILIRRGKGPASGAAVSLPVGFGRQASLKIDFAGYEEYSPMSRSHFRGELAELLARHQKRLSRAGVKCRMESPRKGSSLRLVIAGADGGTMMRIRKILVQLSNAPVRPP